MLTCDPLPLMCSYRHHFPQWVPNLFRYGLAAVSNLPKSFVLSAHFVEKRVQNIRTDSSRVFVMSDDFTHSHSDLHFKFVSVPFGIGPGSLP